MQSTPALGVHLGLLKTLRTFCLTLVWTVEETLDWKSKDPDSTQNWQSVTLLKSLSLSDPCFLSAKIGSLF